MFWFCIAVITGGAIAILGIAKIIDSKISEIDHDIKRDTYKVTPEEIVIVLKAILHTFTHNLSPHEKDCICAAVAMFELMREDSAPDNKEKMLRIYNIVNGFAALCADKNGITSENISAAADAGIDKITKIIEDSNEM